MYLNVVNDDGSLNRYHISKEDFFDGTLYGQVGYIGTQAKESNALNILKAYFSNAKAILVDNTNKVILDRLKTLNISELREKKRDETIFDQENFSLMYFTSGSTGHPVAALKTKKNIESEVSVLIDLLEKYKIKKVIVTVPFIHLYGTLFGLMFPLIKGIDIVLKEHFLPHELLNMIDDNSMVVTTPLYIKALNKLSEKKDLSHSIFISSTGPLDSENIIAFNQQYRSDIIQIFGSTETGGIAYKINDDTLWKPFEYVDISTNENNELKVNSPFVSPVLYEDRLKQTYSEIQTFDYIEQEPSGFKLIGRSSKIFKLAGKRYSTIQVENILEKVDGINKALVFVELENDSLRGEYLDITLETKKAFSAKEIKKILQCNLSNLKFSIKLTIVEKIPINQIGKKLRIK
ncbi:MAG TPA: AMP-binding protein [Sulfurovum sp.]|uniref:AMP-binding protein n=1 Tax=Sulfurovum sp. TaxID=1969726 RepID=UPI002F9286A7